MSSDRPPIWQRYRDLLRRRPRDEVDDELRFHLDMRIDEAKRAGLSEDSARRGAHERFGEFRAIEAELLELNRVRERRLARTEWFADLRHDVLFAVRSLRRAPSFAIAAIATLGIAIGANTAIYSVVHALLLAALPYGRPEQLVTPVNWGWSTGELLGLREQFRSASDVGGYLGTSANIDDGVSAERVESAEVSSNFFSLLQRAPLVGRTFAIEESDPGRNRVIVLSEGLWRTRFGGDTTAVGRRVMVDGVPTAIVGVMPADFAFPSAATTFWRPFVINRADPISLWASGGHRIIARLRARISVTAARREMQRIALGLRHANTIWDPGPGYAKDADLKPLQDELVGGTRPSLLLLLGCTALVLLIACTNVANLLLARATARERELAVRAALGGGRGRLVRQLLTESVVLSLAGGVFGLALAAGGVRWIVSAMPHGIPRASEISMNGAAFGFTAALAVFTGIIFGLLPALRATSARSRTDAVRSGRTGHGIGHQRVSAALVVGEVALAVMLAVAAELLVRSFNELRRADPGFRTAHIISARVTPNAAAYPDAARVSAFYETIMSRLAAMPGVQHVGGVNTLPLAKQVSGMGLRIEGQFEDFTHALPTMDHSQFVTPGYMATMGMRLLSGRGFTDQDQGGAQLVAIVSESMAKRFWPAGDAIGKRIGFPYKSPWITVVGITSDVHTDSLRDAGTIAVYVPFAQRPQPMGVQAELTIVASTTGDPDPLGPAIRSLIANVDRAVPVSAIRSMDDVLLESIAKPRFTMTLVGGFALVALLLGAVGIYGVMSYIVGQRAQELSIRAALGAGATHILVMVVARAATLAGIGAVIGIVAALAAARPLRTFLYGVSASDPLAYATIALLFVTVAIAASTGPARRAARANPASALRAD